MTRLPVQLPEDKIRDFCDRDAITEQELFASVLRDDCRRFAKVN